MSDLGRKDCWSIAEHRGERTPHGLQHLLSRAVGDADGVRDDLRGYVADHLGHQDAVLVVDETGDLKRGKQTVGVRGLYDQAVVDLGATLGGIVAGREWELLPGTIRTFLGSAYWLRGDWEMEALHVRLVPSATDTYRSSLVVSTLSYGASGRGEFDEADALLAEWEAALVAAPWQEPAQYLYFAHVVRLHADSTAEQRSRLLPNLRSRLPVARPYLDRTAVLTAPPTGRTTGAAVPATGTGSAADDLAAVYGLSDREVDVCTSLSSGMSYVQIAKELFITRSTVAYHLGNV